MLASHDELWQNGGYNKSRTYFCGVAHLYISNRWLKQATFLTTRTAAGVESSRYRLRETSLTRLTLYKALHWAHTSTNEKRSYIISIL